MDAAMPPTDARLALRKREDALGADIIDECRAQLMMRFRFLDLALWRMGLEPARVQAAYPLATDGSRIVYDPPRIIARFQESFDESVRDCLHMVMHCVFRHPFDESHRDQEAWGLACDIIVESTVMDLCGARFASPDDVARREALDRIAMLAGSLVPGKIYEQLHRLVQTPAGQQYRGMGRSTLNEWHALFERDDHGAWPANAKGQPDGEGDEGTGGLSEDGDAPEADVDGIHVDSPEQPGAEQAPAHAPAPDPAAGDEGPAEAGEGLEGPEEAEGSEGQAAPDALVQAAERPEREEGAQRDGERAWEDVARQMEMNLETFSREWGHEAASLLANLAIANRRTIRYADFLRRFMVRTEETMVNQDEFDLVCYAYGLELYGNMPLIEPLEYQETERVRDFAIVIDTSESVSGELVRSFLRHTFQMLKESEDYASEVNIHIIQCDAKVQSDTKVTDLRSVDALMEGLVVRGFGGTDFRPAFDYVDLLAKRGEFDHLKGLIYFTDGYGTFPERPPAFDAAFVFVDDGETPAPPVPPWACKLLLSEESLAASRKDA